MKCKGTKYRYKDKAAAMTAISKLRSKGLNAKRAYKCKVCNCWHLTTQKKRIWRMGK